MCEDSDSFLMMCIFGQLPSFLPSVLSVNLSAEPWFLGSFSFPSPLETECHY